MANKTRKINDLKMIPMQREPDIEVVFENCRESPMGSGYRPAHLVKDNYLTTGQHNYYDAELLEKGKTTKGTITFIAPEHHMHCFEIGQRIQFQEGDRITGYATITKIFNSHLERKETYFIAKNKLPGSAYYEFQRTRKL